jgi:hypothetical protein
MPVAAPAGPLCSATASEAALTFAVDLGAPAVWARSARCLLSALADATALACGNGCVICGRSKQVVQLRGLIALSWTDTLSRSFLGNRSKEGLASEPRIVGPAHLRASSWRMGVVGTVHVAVLVRAAVSEAAADWLSPTLLSLVTLRSAPVLAVDVADDAFAAPAQGGDHSSAWRSIGDDRPVYVTADRSATAPLAGDVMGQAW